MAKERWEAYIPLILDEMPLSTNAFRVYCNLRRRAGGRTYAYPSCETIGEDCFRAESGSTTAPGSLRRRAQRAIKELVDLGMVEVEQRKAAGNMNRANIYHLLPPEQWRRDGSRSRLAEDEGDGQGVTLSRVGENTGVRVTPVSAECDTGVHEYVTPVSHRRGEIEGEKKKGRTADASLSLTAKSQQRTATATAGMDIGDVVEVLAIDDSRTAPTPLVPLAPPPTPAKPTAVFVYTEITGRKPTTAQVELMAVVKSRNLWQETLTEWLKEHWNPTNVEGMVDRYLNKVKAEEANPFAGWLKKNRKPKDATEDTERTVTALNTVA